MIKLKHSEKKYQKQLALMDERDWFVRICAIHDFRNLLLDEMNLIKKKLKLKKKITDPEENQRVLEEINKLSEPVIPFVGQASDKIHSMYTQAKNLKLRVFTINAMGAIGGTRFMGHLKKIFRAQPHSEEMLLQINLAIGGIHKFDMFRLNLLAGERYNLYLEAELKKKSWEEDLAKILLHFGRNFGKNQQFDQAKKFFEKAVEVQPKEPYNWIFLGQAHESLNELAEAEQYYQKATEVDPKFELAWYSVGQIHYKRKEIQQALECFKKAVDCELKNETNHFFVGLMHFLLKDFDQAEKSWNYVFYLNSNHPETKQHMQLLKEARKKFG